MGNFVASITLICICAAATSTSPALTPMLAFVAVLGAAGHSATARAPAALAGRSAYVARRSQPAMKLTTNWLDYSFGLQDPALPVPGNPAPDAPPEPFTVTKKQVQALKRDGVVHIKGVLTPEWLEYMREVTRWQIDHPHMWASPGVVSGLYDYIQRNVWSTNTNYAKFMYYSPLASILAHLGETDEVRISTDLLMVNPNKGFKWHQDNQNGPVSHYDALRFWVTLDDTPADHGAPVYLKASHMNECVGDDKVFVELDEGDLPKFNELLEFRPKAGDLLVWHPRAIHKIDGPDSQDWGARLRRVLGGTVILGKAPYVGEGKALFSDLGAHSFKNGDMLEGPLFPRVYPSSVPAEREARDRGECTRTVEVMCDSRLTGGRNTAVPLLKRSARAFLSFWSQGVMRLMSNMWASAGEMVSFTNVVNPTKKKDADATNQQSMPEPAPASGLRN